MKYVKKILRLLPLIFVLTGFMFIVFNNMLKSETGTVLENIDYLYGPWQAYFNNFNNSFNNTFFYDIINWFKNNISDNYLFIYSVCVLIYELFLSLAFLMFDSINLVFIWANKFINKGVDLE